MRPTAPDRPSGFRALFSRRMLAMLLLGFSSGLPLLLVGGTLQAWLKDEGVRIEEIGLFALVGLPYTLKFLWAPLFDRFTPRFLGRRRGWAVATQTALALAIAALGLARPSSAPWAVAALALAVAFASASQDIVLDAYRREALVERELGLGTAVFINGYRLAMLVSGALALALADLVPWRAVYFIMAGFVAVGAATILCCREPRLAAPPPRTLGEAVVQPFVEFFRRRGAWLTLLFILLYKLGDQMAVALTTPFVLDLGFTKTELAAVVKLFGMGATLAGGFLGAPFMVRLGVNRSLWVFGALQALGILGYAALAEAGRAPWVLAGAVTVENLTAGMGAAAYAAYMASQTNTRFSATQYALFSSLMGVPRVLLAAPTGFLAHAFGWPSYFLFCALMAVPGMAMLPLVAPWGRRGGAREA